MLHFLISTKVVHLDLPCLILSWVSKPLMPEVAVLISCVPIVLWDIVLSSCVLIVLWDVIVSLLQLQDQCLSSHFEVTLSSVPFELYLGTIVLLYDSAKLIKDYLCTILDQALYRQ